MPSTMKNSSLTELEPAKKPWNEAPPTESSQLSPVTPGPTTPWHRSIWPDLVRLTTREAHLLSQISALFNQVIPSLIPPLEKAFTARLGPATITPARLPNLAPLTTRRPLGSIWEAEAPLPLSHTITVRAGQAGLLLIEWPHRTVRLMVAAIAGLSRPDPCISPITPTEEAVLLYMVEVALTTINQIIQQNTQLQEPLPPLVMDGSPPRPTQQGHPGTMITYPVFLDIMGERTSLKVCIPSPGPLTREKGPIAPMARPAPSPLTPGPLFQNIPIPVQVGLPPLFVPLATLQQVEPGDLLLTGHHLPKGRNNHWYGEKVPLNRLPLRLLRPPWSHPANRETGKERPMPQEIIMPPTREEFPETNDLEPHSILNLQDLPIQLQVVLGTVTLKLSEIMDLNPGTVFSLPWIGENRVHIFYEDKKIGTGSLVTIDDQLGVCIEEVDNSLTVEGESPMEPGCWHR